MWGNESIYDKIPTEEECQKDILVLLNFLTEDGPDSYDPDMVYDILCRCKTEIENLRTSYLRLAKMLWRMI